METADRTELLADMQILGNVSNAYEEILTPGALEFVRALHYRFNDRRLALLAARKQVQTEIDAGATPDFSAETADVRSGDWVASPIPSDLQDRRVEITGPVDRKMVINALNSGAKMFMADFEDSNSPSWDNNIQGQINLRDAIRRTIGYAADNGKQYSLNDDVATLMVRPRGLHLEEKQIKIGDQRISGSLLDFGLYFFHNARELIHCGSGPYFYLPKLEHHLEARWWNEVFVFAQDYCKVAQGTIKATVLVETILAAFQLHEILFELREHTAGLNCGRWDYIFSFIKKFRNRPGCIFPERGQVTMTVPFMRAYTQLVVQTCHKRGVHAIGGMAAQIPIKNDPAANEAALEKVRQDKLREVTDGHDGTWVAHPALVAIAKKVFDEHMPTPNQIQSKPWADFSTSTNELLAIPEGTITEAGLRLNINVGILYLESWLRGNGAAAIHNLMEDAATAEISRTQLWQWLRAGAKLDDNRTITQELYQELRDDEIRAIRELVGKDSFTTGKFDLAIALFDQLVLGDDYEEFLTLNAYQYLV